MAPSQGSVVRLPSGLLVFFFIFQHEGKENWGVPNLADVDFKVGVQIIAFVAMRYVSC